MTWRKDSQPLLADGRIQLLDTDRVLRIQSIRREDAGIYQCFAENDRDASQAVALLRLDGECHKATSLDATLGPLDTTECHSDALNLDLDNRSSPPRRSKSPSTTW